MNLHTIKQLDEWMEVNCYNDGYGIGNRNIHEGYGLSVAGNKWVWYYTERGQRSHLNYFEKEQDAVEFAYLKITADKSANRHLVGFIKDHLNESALIKELHYRNIGFLKDIIPYGGPGDTRTRIFVFGCDIKKVTDLEKIYNELR